MNREFVRRFAIAYGYTLAMLLILQLTDGAWFIVTLILMHGGILAMIRMRRTYRRRGVDTKPFAMRAYVVFALFLPVLIYRFGGYLFAYAVDEGIVLISSLGIIAAGIIVGVSSIIAAKDE